MLLFRSVPPHSFLGVAADFAVPYAARISTGFFTVFVVFVWHRSTYEIPPAWIIKSFALFAQPLTPVQPLVVFFLVEV